jgi:8-oxo-dGTP pyrophosphatase MutT (NUDIX family)
MKVEKIRKFVIGPDDNTRHAQFGAICYRVHKGDTQILLITSRGTGRWIIPKGWPMPDRGPSGTALREAFEEAGVEGRAHDRSIGTYSYEKWLDDAADLSCAVMVYAVEVEKLLKRYPEQAQRRRKWFSPEEAAALVNEPELKDILLRFDAKSLT